MKIIWSPLAIEKASEINYNTIIRNNASFGTYRTNYENLMEELKEHLKFIYE